MQCAIDALAALPTSDRYLVRLGPGTYQLPPQGVVTMAPGVDLEGAGTSDTLLYKFLLHQWGSEHNNGVRLALVGAANAELRDLQILANFDVVGPGLAVRNAGTDFKLVRVSISAKAGTYFSPSLSTGLYSSARMQLEDVQVNTRGWYETTGLHFEGGETFRLARVHVEANVCDRDNMFCGDDYQTSYGIHADAVHLELADTSIKLTQGDGGTAIPVLLVNGATCTGACT